MTESPASAARRGLALAAAVALAAAGPAAAEEPWCGVEPLPVAAEPAPGGVTASFVGEFVLSGDDAPEGLSGVAWLGEDASLPHARFAFADDSGGLVRFADVFFDDRSGAVTGCAFRAVSAVCGATDLEGVAFDPRTRSLWVSDECGPALFRAEVAEDGSALKPGTQRDMASLVPPSLRKCRKNRALEALSFDALERVLWTASESAICGDEEGSARLAAIDPATGRFREHSFPLEEAAGAHLPPLPPPFTGLCALAALPGGRLVALERSFGYEIADCGGEEGGLRQSLCRMTLSLVETDGVESGGKIRKTVLFRALTGDANYEGLCLGPPLPDGGRRLVAVADGDVSRSGSFSMPWRKAVAVFRLDGI